MFRNYFKKTSFCSFAILKLKTASKKNPKTMLIIMAIERLKIRTRTTKVKAKRKQSKNAARTKKAYMNSL